MTGEDSAPSEGPSIACATGLWVALAWGIAFGTPNGQAPHIWVVTASEMQASHPALVRAHRPPAVKGDSAPSHGVAGSPATGSPG